MIETFINDGKTFTHIENLTNWEKNPRGIMEDDFENLKKSIVKRGQFRPLIITEDGVVLGGNMRLKAYLVLGVRDVWISIVDASNDQKKLEYALADNARSGYYDEEKLAELIASTPELDMNEFKVDLGSLTNLVDLLNRFSPEDESQKVDEKENLTVICEKCGHKHTCTPELIPS